MVDYSQNKIIETSLSNIKEIIRDYVKDNKHDGVYLSMLEFDGDIKLVLNTSNKNIPSIVSNKNIPTIELRLGDRTYKIEIPRNLNESYFGEITYFVKRIIKKMKNIQDEYNEMIDLFDSLDAIVDDIKIENNISELEFDFTNYLVKYKASKVDEDLYENEIEFYSNGNILGQALYNLNYHFTKRIEHLLDNVSEYKDPSLFELLKKLNEIYEEFKNIEETKWT